MFWTRGKSCASVHNNAANDNDKVLGIALTDTFGTPAFLDAFRKPIPEYTSAGAGAVSTTASGAATTVQSAVQSESTIEPPVAAPIQKGGSHPTKTYAQVYDGVRQDSGDPANFVKIVRQFYDREGITSPKTMVFSDSLTIDLCLEYKTLAEEARFKPVFGVGTFFTSELLSDSSCELLLISRY